MSISIRSTLLLAALLILTNCKKTPDPTPPATEVKGAHDALSETQRLILQTIISGQPIPSAPLGMYVTSYLIDATGMHFFSAKNGVNAGMNLLLSNQEKPEESFALLQELGINLQINVPDMLNRSNDRQKTLDLYIETLSDVYTRSKSQLSALKQQQKNLLNEQHDARGVVTSIQHDLNLALQKQDYVTASNKQSSIIEAKAAQSKVESEVSELKSTIAIFTSLNKIADKRLSAIAANRLILIAGLQVINVPGIDDLDILKKGNAYSTDRVTPFGSTDL